MRTSPAKRFDDLLKKIFAISISDQSKTCFRPKLRRCYDIFATSLCRPSSFHYKVNAFVIRYTLPVISNTKPLFSVAISLQCLDTQFHLNSVYCNHRSYYSRGGTYKRNIQEEHPGGAYPTGTDYSITCSL